MIAACVRCGEPFERRRSNQRYCCESCRDAAYAEARGEARKGRPSMRGRPVVRDGRELYATVEDAAWELATEGRTRHAAKSIVRCASGKARTAYGSTWEFADGDGDARG